ncbi:choice-of-anchor Q domain-containing protein [Pseudoruegeria sp. HB172150]|uniref:choice-of-anchor Q domain-containing protein n=1 Tax=Pseudoruegeria sp. HB172150 TaxID=2721164 RepID=UPI0015550DA0|nr:choice-of-anchor Q domain-containing protein [Pseudoruegeria sp. HB172150]
MATLVVTTLADEPLTSSTSPDLATESGDGAGLSLREAIGLAEADPDADTILFAEDLANGRIALAGRTLEITTDITIDGDAIGGTTSRIVVDAEHSTKAFTVRDGVVQLSNFDITGGGDPTSESYGVGDGGGVWVGADADLTIVDSRIYGNIAGAPSGSYGGGIYNEGTLHVLGSEIFGNSAGVSRAASSGGGIANMGTLYLEDTSITDNHTSGRVIGNGGGLLNYGTTYATNILIAGNAGLLGSGIYNAGTFIASGATVTGNTMADTFYSGTTGIYNSAEMTLIQSTVTANKGPDITNRAELTLANSIVPESPGWIVYKEGRNIIGAGVYDGDTLVGTVALTDIFADIGPNGPMLTDNGGPFPTLALRASSDNPALDSGDDALATDALGAALVTDARGEGFTRFTDLAFAGVPGGNRVDLGAVELAPDFADALEVGGDPFAVLSYSGRQDHGTFEIDSYGLSLIQTGNAWNHVAVDYDVTEDTVLTFRYRTMVEGEIHAIGFENDDRPDATTFFQLDGSQRFGIQDFAGSTSEYTLSFNIPVGEYFTGHFDRLVFVTDQDEVPADEADLAMTYWNNIQLFEDVPYMLISGERAPVSSYSEAQDRGSFEFFDDNYPSIMFQGSNSWVKAAIDYEVTEDTILEFWFDSTAEGEIHAIGFDNDDVPDSETYFAIAGTQEGFGIRDFHDSDNVGASLVHIQIPVGDYFTGHFDSLVFVTDDDANTGADSVWADFTLTEYL